MVKQILTTVFMCGVILITSPNIANANNVTVGNDNEQLKAVVDNSAIFSMIFSSDLSQLIFSYSSKKSFTTAFPSLCRRANFLLLVHHHTFFLS